MFLRHFVRTSCNGTVIGRKRPSLCSVHRTAPPPPRRFVGAYENDGKTYVSMLNNHNIKDGIMISSYSQLGFRLNNNFMVLGPVICFANSIMAWYIDDDKDVSEDSLSLLFHLEPMPSIIVLGIGDNTYRKQIDKVVNVAAKKYGCNIEVLPIDAALATYNFIVNEQRHVAGAFIPPKFIPVIDDDVITANARHMHLYGEDVPKNEIWVENEETNERIHKNYKEFAEIVGAQKKIDVERQAAVDRAKPKKIK